MTFSHCMENVFRLEKQNDTKPTKDGHEEINEHI